MITSCWCKACTASASAPRRWLTRTTGRRVARDGGKAMPSTHSIVVQGILTMSPAATEARHAVAGKHPWDHCLVQALRALRSGWPAPAGLSSAGKPDQAIDKLGLKQQRRCRHRQRGDKAKTVDNFAGLDRPFPQR